MEILIILMKHGISITHSPWIHGHIWPLSEKLFSLTPESRHHTPVVLPLGTAGSIGINIEDGIMEKISYFFGIRAPCTRPPLRPA